MVPRVAYLRGRVIALAPLLYDPLGERPCVYYRLVVRDTEDVTIEFDRSFHIRFGLAWKSEVMPLLIAPTTWFPEPNSAKVAGLRSARGRALLQHVTGLDAVGNSVAEAIIREGDIVDVHVSGQADFDLTREAADGAEAIAAFREGANATSVQSAQGYFPPLS